MSKRLGSANLKIKQITKGDFSNIMGHKQLQVIATTRIFQPAIYLFCELLSYKIICIQLLYSQIQ